jgi:hypothetical protein
MEKNGQIMTFSDFLSSLFENKGNRQLQFKHFIIQKMIIPFFTSLPKGKVVSKLIHTCNMHSVLISKADRYFY